MAILGTVPLRRIMLVASGMLSVLAQSSPILPRRSMNGHASTRPSLDLALELNGEWHAEQVTNGISVVTHEREDETVVYPRLLKVLADGHGLSAMSRAHREILHQARLLARLAYGLRAEDADKYLVRDAQRAIKSIEALVRIHNAQEEDIYEHAVRA